MQRRMEHKRRQHQDRKWALLMEQCKSSSEQTKLQVEIEKIKEDRQKVDTMFQERERDIIEDTRESFQLKYVFAHRKSNATGNAMRDLKHWNSAAAATLKALVCCC